MATGDGLQLDVDLNVDWRQDDPVTLDVGPVLSLADAVGNKVSALCSRGEPCDNLDVDAIRASGRFSDDQLIVAAVTVTPVSRSRCLSSNSQGFSGSPLQTSTATASPPPSWSHQGAVRRVGLRPP